MEREVKGEYYGGECWDYEGGRDEEIVSWVFLGLEGGGGWR
jgi:hypothetical protein